ncbi:hypothetical protein GEMRC1_000371 [Eukaryota sp. GEM-RC1]
MSTSDDLKSRVDALRRQVVTLQLYSLGNDQTSATNLRAQILNESLNILNSVGADTSFLEGADPNDPSTFTADVSLICRIRRAINGPSTKTPPPSLPSRNSRNIPSTPSPSVSPQRVQVPRPEDPPKSTLSIRETALEPEEPFGESSPTRHHHSYRQSPLYSPRSPSIELVHSSPSLDYDSPLMNHTSRFHSKLAPPSMVDAAVQCTSHQAKEVGQHKECNTCAITREKRGGLCQIRRAT